MRKYQATGSEAEFQPGSRDRVLSNSLGIVRVRDMQVAESQALRLAQDAAIEVFDAERRFTAEDVCALHQLWLGPIYPWAGSYRSVNIGKGGFQFAHAPLIPRLMAELERGPLLRLTPCRPGDLATIALALAETHAELILVHPFREGNGRLARLLALLMGLQAGLPPLDFTPLAGRGKRSYISGIHAALARDYAPLAQLFQRVIERSLRHAVAATNKP